MKRNSFGPVIMLVFVIGAFALGFLLARQSILGGAAPTQTPRRIAQAAPSKTPTIRSGTPLATLTPSRTLKPPPTLEPPTATVAPSNTPVDTLTPTLDLSINIPGLHGLETATPPAPVGCEPRKDWKLIYTVKRNDALSRIADLYNTSVKELLQGNCLTDPNRLVIGQELRVPGKAHPTVPAVVCGPFEVLTPFDGTMNVAGGGTLSFVWHGPRSPRTLLRITRPDGSIFESVVELRQNEIVDAYKNLWAAGTYKWQLFPLDNNFQQVCPESPIYSFTKEQGPTATPTQKSGPTS